MAIFCYTRFSYHFVKIKPKSVSRAVKIPGSSKQFVKCGYLATQHLGGEEKEQIFIPILASLLVIPQPIFKVNVIIPLSHP